MPAPKLNPDGSCPACAHGWQCSYHQIEGITRDRLRSQALAFAAAGARAAEIDRTCAAHELEDDEFQSSYQKARAILGRKSAFTI